MSNSCAGKVAVVTGASRGIGQAIARRLASEGAKVVAVSRTLRSGSGEYAGSLEETVELVNSNGGEAIVVQADLLKDDDLIRIIATAKSDFGQEPQILINNAAATRHFELTFPFMDNAAFTESFTVNVWAPWKLSILALEGMKRAGSGWIVNISSRGAAPIAGPPFVQKRVGAQSLYGTTKAAIDRLTTAAAMELYEYGIAANTLAPTAPVLTENARKTAGLDESVRNEPVETVAEAALALSTCDAWTVTGRITYSLPLLTELRRPVYTLDGKELLDGWQPNQIDPALLWHGYLIEPGPIR